MKRESLFCYAKDWLQRSWLYLNSLTSLYPFSEFPTEAGVEDFTGTAVEEDEDEEDEGEEEEDVVEDRDYYYDSYKVDDYNEETTTEPTSDKAVSEKEVSSDMKCKSCSGLQASSFLVLMLAVSWWWIFDQVSKCHLEVLFAR